MQNPKYKVLLWDKTLETGVKRIDEQHRQLLQYIESLVVAIAEKKGEEKVKELISFLDIYVDTHFNFEHNTMKRFNFPQTAGHFDQHLRFVEKFKEKEKKYLQNGSSQKLAAEIANDLWGWFKEHICKYDKKLGVFLKVRKLLHAKSDKIDGTSKRDNKE